MYRGRDHQREPERGLAVLVRQRPDEREPDRHPLARQDVADPHREDVGPLLLGDRGALAGGDRTVVGLPRLGPLAQLGLDGAAVGVIVSRSRRPGRAAGRRRWPRAARRTGCGTWVSTVRDARPVIAARTSSGSSGRLPRSVPRRRSRSVGGVPVQLGVGHRVHGRASCCGASRQVGPASRSSRGVRRGEPRRLRLGRRRWECPAQSGSRRHPARRRGPRRPGGTRPRSGGRGV